MNLNFLPSKISNGIKNLSTDKLYEIRIRLDYPIILLYDNNKFYLGKNGITNNKSLAIYCESFDIEHIIKTITEHSIYAFNDKLKQGFLPTKDGLRIGVAGECVFENNQIVTIKNITSLNIRIPHNVLDCSNKLFDYLLDETNFLPRIYNSLIISPPTCGKTTILKDLIRKIDLLNYFSILVIDERGELSNVKGQNVDTIKFSNKLFAFKYGIRSLAPNIIITDELSTFDDWKCVQEAVNSGVKVIATCHAESIKDVVQKEYYIKELFDRFFCLKNKGKIGVLSEVYDKTYKLI